MKVGTRATVFLLGVLLWGCGVKAPPIPPDLVVPKAPKATLKVREGKVYILWEPPRENVDGSEPVEIQHFQVLRREGCSRCPGGFEVVDQIPFIADKGSYTWREEEVLKGGTTYVYRLRGVNRWGFPGPPSEDMVLPWTSPPPPPRGLGGRGGDQRVELQWEAIGGVKAYHVYRRPPEAPYPFDPLALVESERFVDRGLPNGKTFCYQVRGVILSGRVPVEGPGAQEVCLTPEDVTPPSPPGGLVAFKRDGVVELDWFPVEAEELTGYHVWRGRCGGRLGRITERPLKETVFYDTPPEEGCWVYAVTAVDASPRRNESPPSRTVKVHY